MEQANENHERSIIVLTERASRRTAELEEARKSLLAAAAVYAAGTGSDARYRRLDALGRAADAYAAASDAWARATDALMDAEARAERAAEATTHTATQAEPREAIRRGEE